MENNLKDSKKIDSFPKVFSLLLNLPSVVYSIPVTLMLIPLVRGRGNILSLIFLAIGFSILLYLFMNVYFKENVLRFCILFFCLIGLFPALHCLNFKYDPSAYKASDKLDTDNTNIFRERLLPFKDSSLVKSSLLELNDSLLDLCPENAIQYGPIHFIYSNMRPEPMPHGFDVVVQKQMEMYDWNGKYCFTLYNAGRLTIRQFLRQYIDQLESLKIEIGKKKEHIFYRDIWFASVFGFWNEEINFYGFKASSIRILQILCAIGVLTMMGDYIKSTGLFTLRKRE